jgi:HPt (histidine-containing phosphotransfer) domain-containing protein
MDAYLSKPIRFEDLRDALADWSGRPAESKASIDPTEIQHLASDVGLDLDDPAFHRRFVAGYLDDVSDYLNQIERGIDDRDAEAVRQGGHALKGSSIALGATAVVRQCDAIQQAAEAADWDALCPMVGALRDELAAVRAELTALAD